MRTVGRRCQPKEDLVQPGLAILRMRGHHLAGRLLTHLAPTTITHQSPTTTTIVHRLFQGTMEATMEVTMETILGAAMGTTMEATMEEMGTTSTMLPSLSQARSLLEFALSVERKDTLPESALPRILLQHSQRQPR